MYIEKVYTYPFIQTDDWSYTFMSTSLYRLTTVPIRYEMYKDKVYVYTVIWADGWSYTVVDV